MQILYKDNIIIVDTGFGCSNLGEELMQRILTKNENLNIHILYTHFHWDHIQGLPFFHPIYFPQATLNLYSPRPYETTMENLDILFDGSYSPFDGLLAMPSNVIVQRAKQNMLIDDLKVEFAPLDHGDTEAFAYKFTSPDGDSVCIATDHEARNSEINDHLVSFCQNCDILVHDATYNEAEYPKHYGWGHSTAKQALENAAKIKPSKLILTHHEPTRLDRDIFNWHRRLTQYAKFRGIDFEFAREDFEYKISSSIKQPTKKVS